MITGVLLALLASSIVCRYVPQDTENVHDVEEIQHAVCKVATEEIQASANASITRQLKGVCSTKAMNHRMDELQQILFTELQVLKLMLQSAGYTTPKPFILVSSTPATNQQSDEMDDYDYGNEVDDYNKGAIVKSLEYHNSTNNITTTHSALHNGSEAYLREGDVKQNETIISTDFGEAFVYFWKINEASGVLEDDVYLSSPSIEFLGETIFIKFTTRYLGSQYASLELLESATFKRSYRFVILRKDRKDDLNSPLLGGTKGRIFRVLRENLQKYIIANDFILIKILVYLEK